MPTLSTPEVEQVRFLGLIPRLPGLSVQEFHDHYQHPHGTLVLQMPGLVTYMQSHQFDSPLLDESPGRLEAIAECLFASRDATRDIADSELFRTYVGPDEANFVDATRLNWL